MVTNRGSTRFYFSITPLPIVVSLLFIITNLVYIYQNQFLLRINPLSLFLYSIPGIISLIYLIAEINNVLLKKGFLDISSKKILYQTHFYKIEIPYSKIKNFELFSSTRSQANPDYLGIETIDQAYSDFGNTFIFNIYIQGKYKAAIPLRHFSNDERDLILYTLNNYV